VGKSKHTNSRNNLRTYANATTLQNPNPGPHQNALLRKCLFETTVAEIAHASLFSPQITDLKARVQDREARTVDLRSDLKEARAEKQRLQESLQREQQATSEQRAQLKEGERRLAEEQTRVKQLTAALAAATHATEDAKK
jgi:predicted nuclease with TOPRIM domain